MTPSGLDKEQLLIQISRLEDSLNSLEKSKNAGLSKETTRAAIERLLQVSIEEVINIGNHLISGLGLTRPDTYREIFIVLEKEKIIDQKLSEELQRFAVFRNRLVHLYWKIGEAEFKGQLAKINLLRDFVKVITRVLKSKKLL